MAGISAALVVIASLVLFPTAAFAGSVSGVSFAPSNNTVGATSTWTVGFTATGGLGASSTIDMVFNPSFDVSGVGSSTVTLGSNFGKCAVKTVGHPTSQDIQVTLNTGQCNVAALTSLTISVGGVVNSTTAGSYAGSSFTVKTSADTTATPAGSPVVITAAAVSQLAFVQGTSDAFAGTAMSPAVTVQATDRYSNAVSGVSITLTPSAGSISSGASSSTDSTGLATFSGLTFNNTALGLSLVAKAGTLSSAPSASFNVTIKVTSSSATLTDTATDTGAGVKQVSYYYCSEYSGACTNGTLIGSSTNASGNFPVTWTGQPANGAYRVVAVSTDNVGNVSSASVPTPVTVSN